MRVRVISALYLLPLLFFLVAKGIPLLILCTFLSLFTCFEFCNGMEVAGTKINRDLVYGCIAFLYLLLFLARYSDFMAENIFMFELLWLILCSSLLLVYAIVSRFYTIDTAVISVFLCVYLGLFPSFIYLSSKLPAHANVVWLIILSSFGSDIFAYFGGSMFGRHKLAPVLSPKKTIEGSACGILASLLLCGFVGHVLFPQDTVYCYLLGLLGGVVSEAGDLVASAFKRKMGIKDFSNLIPGHGGLLDRFDSVIFVAPFIYWFAYFLLRA